MNCDDALQLITARIDGELADVDPLDTHLDTCVECRMTQSVLTLQDGELRRAFAAPRAAAQRVAEQVVDELRPRVRRLPWLIVGAAAAIVLLGIFLPALSPVRISGSSAIVAHLTVSTGEVEVRDHRDAVWAPAEIGDIIRNYGHVRTAPESRCEWHMDDGRMLRLEGDSEVVLSHDIELLRGRLWARDPHAPSSSTLQVADHELSMNATTVDATTAPDGAEIIVLEGQATIAGTAPITIPANHSVTLSTASIGTPVAVADPILNTLWIHDILLRKERNNPEMAQRMNALVRAFRDSRDDAAYEQAIRSCGYAANGPLAKAMKEKPEPPYHTERARLADLFSDLAEPWCIPELIAMLHDTEPDVRVAGARALHRLTGQTFGRTPESYHQVASASSCDTNVDPWTLWWDQNKHKYPKP